MIYNILNHLNKYNILIKDAIVYLYIPGSEEDNIEESEAYLNYTQTGILGTEIEAKVVFQKFYGSFGYGIFSHTVILTMPISLILMPNSNL